MYLVQPIEFGWIIYPRHSELSTMMAQHLTSMFEQIGNFTKNNLTHNSKLKEREKERENKASANHVGNQQPSPSNKQGQQLPPLKKPFKLRNVASKAESYDTLHANVTTLVSLDLVLDIFQDFALCVTSYSFLKKKSQRKTVWLNLHLSLKYAFFRDIQTWYFFNAKRRFSTIIYYQIGICHKLFTKYI